MKNRERRRAKQAKRRTEQSHRASGAEDAHRTGGPGGPGGNRQIIDAIILRAAHAACTDQADTGALVDLLANRSEEVGGPLLVAERLDNQLVRFVSSALRNGWEPLDVSRVAKRKGGSDVLAFTNGVLPEAARHAGHPAVRMRWDEQLAMFRTDGRSLDPRAGTWPADVAVAIDAIGLLAHLPVLVDLGTVAGHRSAPMDHADAGILDKVRGLLAKAESTEFPEEADAFMAKAQELITRHNLERALADAGMGDGAGHPDLEARRFWLDDPYLPAKALLLAVVADANRCRAISDEDLGFVTLVGHPGDVDGSEVLFTSLLVQATRRMAVAGTVQGAPGSRTRRPSYRRSFLVAYANRIGIRLAETRDAATAAAAAESGGALLPVLARRQDEVEDAVKQLFPKLVQRQMSITDHAGWAAGTAAADLADIGVRLVLPAGAP